MRCKFRAWDKKFEEMCRVVALDFDKDDAWLFSETQDNTEPRPFSEIILMQSTGLRDREGKEIYEGDILGYGDNYACEVYWDNDEHRWGLHEYYPKGENDRFHELDYLSEPMGIIGNIWENKELLNDS